MRPTAAVGRRYHFISDSAQGTTKTFGVKSISVMVTKP